MPKNIFPATFCPSVSLALCVATLQATAYGALLMLFMCKAFCSGSRDDTQIPERSRYIHHTAVAEASVRRCVGLCLFQKQGFLSVFQLKCN